MVPRAEISAVAHQALLNNAPVSGGLSNIHCKQFTLIFAPSCEMFWDLFFSMAICPPSRPYFGNPKNRLGSITKAFPQQHSSKINLKSKILAKNHINSQTGNVSNTDWSRPSWVYSTQDRFSLDSPRRVFVLASVSRNNINLAKNVVSIKKKAVEQAKYLCLSSHVLH